MTKNKNKAVLGKSLHTSLSDKSISFDISNIMEPLSKVRKCPSYNPSKGTYKASGKLVVSLREIFPHSTNGYICPPAFPRHAHMYTVWYVLSLNYPHSYVITVNSVLAHKVLSVIKIMLTTIT